MKLIETKNATATMTSREIAELTGKRHDHVMRDIATMLTQLHGEGGAPKFGDTYKNEQNGQTYPMFCLPYEETICLLTGYDAKARMAVIKRWQELEAAQAIALPKTYSAALLEAGRLAAIVEQKELQIENLNTALDTLLDWVSIIKVAKHNGISEKNFSWHKLKQKSEQLGYTIKKGESPRFGYQNLYHVAAFKACYPQFNFDFVVH